MRRLPLALLATALVLFACIRYLRARAERVRLAARQSPRLELPPGCTMQGKGGAAVPVADGDYGLADLQMNSSALLELVSTLYRKYGAELHPLRQPARALCSALRAKDPTYCSTDDVEAELTYMRVREARPAHVLELAPRAGYSTFFLLSAVRANGVGTVHSYDLEDLLQRPELLVALGGGPRAATLLAEAHRLEVGDARRSLPGRMATGDGRPFFEYIFLDADHSAAFGGWLGGTLLATQAALLQAQAGAAGGRRQAAGGRSPASAVQQRTPVSMHDAFHGVLPSSEAVGALRALPPSALATVRSAGLYTAAKCRLGADSWRGLQRVRARAYADSLAASGSPTGTSSLAEPMHAATNNPTMFFWV